jgi:hypothetical protein
VRKAIRRMPGRLARRRNAATHIQPEDAVTLWWNLRRISSYIRNNTNTLVNYAARHRRGLPISSSIAESAVNSGCESSNGQKAQNAVDGQCTAWHSSGSPSSTVISRRLGCQNLRSHQRQGRGGRNIRRLRRRSTGLPWQPTQQMLARRPILPPQVLHALLDASGTAALVLDKQPKRHRLFPENPSATAFEL